MGENFVTYVAVVDEGIKMTGVGKCGRRGTQIAGHGQLTVARPERSQPLRHITTQHLLQTILAISDRDVIGNRATIML